MADTASPCGRRGPRGCGWRASSPLRGRALRRSSEGIWRGRVAEARRGQTYRFLITTSRGTSIEKADPHAVRRAAPESPDSVLWDLDFRWRDGRWMRSRKRLQASGPADERLRGAPRVVAPRSPDGGFLGYREIGTRLAAYCTEMGFTHVELLPVAEHPFYGSWGYQGAGFFAPTGRYGTPQDFMALVDTLHRAGIGVMLDWVPSHFATDSWGLGRFDGYPLYEHRDPRRGFHPGLVVVGVRLRPARGALLPALECPVLDRAVPHRRPARRCGGLDAVPGLLAGPGGVDPQRARRAARTSAPMPSCARSTTWCAPSSPAW